MTESKVERLAEAFLAHTLPKSEWTHEAHLRVGLWHLLRYPVVEALDLLRDRISRYNVAVGGVNTDTAGYHETVTRFYVGVIARFLSTVDGRRSADELADELVGKWGDKGLPRRSWSAERLDSVEARRGWVEPDLTPG